MIGNRLVLAWDALRSSLWFVPLLIVASLAALAVILIELDGTIQGHPLERFPRIFGAGAEGSRGMLEAIGSAMITVAGVTFSITIVALSLTASQYSSRVLRNFMRDRSNQVVLGIFVGVYGYCLIVLRTIRGEPDPFVPSIATLGGMVLAFVGILLLVHFIHHISTSIQAASILASIHDETSSAIGRLYPEPLGEESDDDQARAHLARLAWRDVPAKATGYVQRVDGDALMKLACAHDAVVRLRCRLGDFVIAGETLASVAAPGALGDLAAKLVDAVSVGSQRTPTQDAAFGMRQIVDIGLKALSPAINDPTTAAMCIDRLTALMIQLARRAIPSPFRFADGELRVVAPAHDFASLLSLAVADLRSAAFEQPAMLARLAEMLGDVGGAVPRGPRRAAVATELVAVAELARSSRHPLAVVAVAAAVGRARARIDRRDA